MKTNDWCAVALLASLWACQQNPAVSPAKVERHENFPSKYVTARNLDVWLPAGYSEEKAYSVLYMHDGQMLFDSTTTWNQQEWGVDEAIAALGNQLKDCIVVGVWNGGSTRHIDYFPQKPWESLPQHFRDSLAALLRTPPGAKEAQYLFAGSVSSDAYLKFLTEEVKPFIDKKYRTIPTAESTFIAGSSMGGLISMYAICEYPQVFGGAACLSTHWIGAFSDNETIPQAFAHYMIQKLPDPATHKLYFDYGTATLDAYYEKHQLRIDSVMRTKGYTDASWTTKRFEGEDHSERAWRKRLHIPLLFLLKR